MEVIIKAKRKYIIVECYTLKDLENEVNSYINNNSGILVGGVTYASSTSSTYQRYIQAMTIAVKE